MQTQNNLQLSHVKLNKSQRAKTHLNYQPIQQISSTTNKLKFHINLPKHKFYINLTIQI